MGTVAGPWSQLAASLGPPCPKRCGALSEAALQALFAPYCGGLSRTSDLLGALQLLQRGSVQGRRAVEGGAGHRYSIRWGSSFPPGTG